VIKTHPDEKKLILGAGFNLFFTKDFEGWSSGRDGRDKHDG
jgi:hypothetical protein